ncbi:MAG: hypothetical protein V3V00_01780 [Saprospiraceae bacterium]
MNFRYIIIIVTLSLLAMSCGGEGCNKKEDTNTVITQPEEKVVDSGTLPGTWEPANDEGILFHYVCPDRCVGGILDYEGNCPVCGKQLHHNSAYHFNNNNPSETPAYDQNIKPRNTANDPSQSPNGIWHFKCANGHGSGEEGNCLKCGAELLHNEDYHTDSANEEAAQNSDGVWHFVCPDEHEGGAGAPLSCDVCGKKLEHNPFYH